MDKWILNGSHINWAQCAEMGQQGNSFPTCLALSLNWCRSRSTVIFSTHCHVIGIVIIVVTIDAPRSNRYLDLVQSG